MDMELTPGSYTLVEVNAPEGYQKVTTEIKFTVGNDGTVTLVTTKVEPAGAVNQLEDGTIILSDATTPELPRLPGIATTVNANGKRAYEEKAVHVTYNETFSPVSISDTVEYINLLKGVTYTVTGTLVKIDANGKIIDPDVKTVTVECEAKDTFGTWTIDFDGVTLEPLAKYVVFESVYAAGGEDETVTKDNPVTHKDVNDKAQTILTEDENGKTLDDVEEGENQSQESSSSDDASKEEDETEDNTIIRNQGKKTGKDSPDTGDSSNTALYVTIAAAAAGIAVTSVMLGTGRKRGRR